MVTGPGDYPEPAMWAKVALELLPIPLTGFKELNLDNPKHRPKMATGPEYHPEPVR